MTNDLIIPGPVPRNRRERRAQIAKITKEHAVGMAMNHRPVAPNYTMRVLLIDGATRKITEKVMRAGPQHFIELLGKRPISWAKIDEVDERVHVMLAGDKSDQEHAPGHRWFEPEFEVLNAAGEASPILHGRAAVFGYMPALEKAGSTPFGPDWLAERVRWIEPGSRPALEGTDVDVPALGQTARLEDKSGEVEVAEEPRGEDLPAVQADRSDDQATLRD
jgi:hypothetical protein